MVVMVEKFRYIRRVSKYNEHLLPEIKSNLQSGNFQPVIDTLSRDQSAYGNVIREGVLTLGRPIGEVESNMEKMANIEIGKMEKNLNHLGLIAGIAPTLGFIGTISGVIKIFYSISITENVSIGNISGGLYEKMISSGSGLVVGIIAFSGYHLLNGMIDNYGLAVQKVNMEFINLIQRPSDGNKTK
jgi:biopolymer transport protein ExbB